MDELNLSPANFQRLVEATTKVLMQVLQNRDNLPSYSTDSTHDDADGWKTATELAQTLKEDAPPETGAALDEVLDLLCNTAPSGGLRSSNSGYCAFVSGGGILHTAVADLVTTTLNLYCGFFKGSPGFVQLESNVISWLAQIVGYDPKTAFGNLTSGGSMANFIGILVARRHHLTEYELTQGVVMMTSQTHSCIAKGLMMAGLPQSSVCQVPMDSSLRMDPEELEKNIVAQKEAGRKPFLVVATGGTTNTGTVDDLRALSNVCKRHGIWLHVDGAYGAPFNLTERGKKILDGLEEADSVCISFHKSLFIPRSTGVLLVKNRHHLREAFTMDALDARTPYLPEFDTSVVNFCEMSPELTRDVRSIRLWLPLKLCGLEKWRIALDERLDWTAEFVRGLRNMADIGIEVCTEPHLTIATFCFMPQLVRAMEDDGRDVSGRPQAPQLHHLNETNHELLRYINRRGNVFLTPTSLDGRFVLRMCTLNIRLTQSRMMSALLDISDGVAQISSQPASAYR